MARSKSKGSIRVWNLSEKHAVSIYKRSSKKVDTHVQDIGPGNAVRFPTKDGQVWVAFKSLKPNKVLSTKVGTTKDQDWRVLKNDRNHKDET